jgi:hypothetical protein
MVEGFVAGARGRDENFELLANPWLPDVLIESARAQRALEESGSSSAVAPPKARFTNGVQPSPMLIGAPAKGGRTAR